MKLREMSRYKAASLHLLISASIAAAALAAMLAFWYPPPYFQAMGGQELMTLIGGVDVALGPLLTLIVFDTRKKSLPFDLACIAILQLGALGYGIHAMHAGRPVFTVFDGEVLTVVSAAELDPADLARGRRDEFRQLSLTGPRMVAVEQPTDREERNQLVFAGLAGLGIQHLPRYYAPYVEHLQEVLAAAHGLDAIVANKEPALGARARAYAERSGRDRATLRYIGIRTRTGLKIAVLDAQQAELLDIL